MGEILFSPYYIDKIFPLRVCAEQPEVVKIYAHRYAQKRTTALVLCVTLCYNVLKLRVSGLLARFSPRTISSAG